jgi:hypothetical protein
LLSVYLYSTNLAVAVGIPVARGGERKRNRCGKGKKRRRYPLIIWSTTFVQVEE